MDAVVDAPGVNASVDAVVDAPGVDANVDAPGVDANVDHAHAYASTARLLSVRLKLRSQDDRRLERPSSPRASNEACREFEL